MSHAVRADDETPLHSVRADGCEFGHALANHLPMVLVALQRLGASPARLAAYAAYYRTAHRLGPPPPPVAPIAREHWAQHLGDRTREADYRAFFAAELRRLGPRDLQRTYLPTLLPGVAASALHALMRLAYAHLAGDAAEIATALSYWAATFLPLPASAETPAAVTDEPAAVLAGLRGHPHLLSIRPATDLLWHAMRAVGADPVFAATLDGLRADPAALPRFAGAALALFAADPSFCALHAVTAMHWVRVIPADVMDRGAALRQVWRALAALYPKMGFPVPAPPAALAEMRATPCPPWPEIVAAAIGSDDEHDHSLVFSAREEEAAWAEPLYRVIAARRMGFIG